MTVLNVGQVQGIFPANQITIDPSVKLTVEGILRLSRLQNSAGLTTLTSTSSGVLTITGNLTTSSRINANTVAATRLVVPIWTTSTRPSSPISGTIGYNSSITSLEFFSGSQWTSISGPLTTV